MPGQNTAVQASLHGRRGVLAGQLCERGHGFDARAVLGGRFSDDSADDGTWGRALVSIRANAAGRTATVRADQSAGRWTNAERSLNGFLDEARTETAGADLDAFGGAVNQGLDGLKIGIEDPLGLVIGVTDVVPGLTPFVADLTRECHG
jgi:hypothetical protein